MLMHIKRILVLLIIILHHNGDTTRWWYRFPSRMADHRIAAAISFEPRFVGDRVFEELLQVGVPTYAFSQVLLKGESVAVISSFFVF